MKNIDLTEVLEKLRAVPDNDIITEIRNLNLDIPEEKLQIAFSTYGLTNFLSDAEINVLRRNVKHIPDSEINAIRWRAVIVFRAYTAFLYMRSNHLENGLAKLSPNSSVAVFRDFFQSESKDKKTIGQHIRNSLAHGTFDLSPDLKSIEFKDYQWKATIGTEDFLEGLCNEVFRFYKLAFEATRA